MTEPDIIRLKGVEYEHIPYDTSPTPLPGERWVAIRPMRKQTGWICACCGLAPGLGPCVKLGGQSDKPGVCLASGPTHGGDWRPFYGKVVD